MEHPHIVKRRGRQEAYDNHKIYASCYAACIGVKVTKETAEEICGKVTSEIDSWILGKDEVSSQEIFEEAGRVMEKYSKDAAFMYKSHRDIS